MSSIQIDFNSLDYYNFIDLFRIIKNYAITEIIQKKKIIELTYDNSLYPSKSNIIDKNGCYQIFPVIKICENKIITNIEYNFPISSSLITFLQNHNDPLLKYINDQNIKEIEFTIYDSIKSYTSKTNIDSFITFYVDFDQNIKNYKNVIDLLIIIKLLYSMCNNKNHKNIIFLPPSNKTLLILTKFDNLESYFKNCSDDMVENHIKYLRNINFGTFDKHIDDFASMRILIFLSKMIN